MSIPWQLLSPARQFLDHPDFIEVRKEYVAKTFPRSVKRLRRLTTRAGQITAWSTAHPIREGTATAGARALAECPLDPLWPEWDGLRAPIFCVIPAADWLTCEAARHLVPVRHLGSIRLQWVIATPPINPESRMRSRRVHATTDIDGRTVHVDLVSNRSQNCGPGRTLFESRVFVDGQLAGRGGTFACSLGVGGSDLPLVARIGGNTAITLDYLWGGVPNVNVWEVYAVRSPAAPVESGSSAVS